MIIVYDQGIMSTILFQGHYKIEIDLFSHVLNHPTTFFFTNSKLATILYTTAT